MRHIFFKHGQRFVNDGITKYTHLVFAQLNESPFRPAEEVMRKTVNDRTPEERVAVQVFAREKAFGKYALKPAFWCVDEQEATEKSATLTAPEWINVTISTDITRLDHA